MLKIKDSVDLEKISLSEEKLSSQYFILQQVLSKYKEIIGVKDEI